MCGFNDQVLITSVLYCVKKYKVLNLIDKER